MIELISDKGNASVVMNTYQYKNNMNDVIETGPSISGPV